MGSLELRMASCAEVAVRYIRQQPPKFIFIDQMRRVAPLLMLADIFLELRCGPVSIGPSHAPAPLHLQLAAQFGLQPAPRADSHLVQVEVRLRTFRKRRIDPSERFLGCLAARTDSFHDHDARAALH